MTRRCRLKCGPVITYATCAWENTIFKWGSKWLLFINSASHSGGKTLCVGGEILNNNGLCVFKDQSEIHNISLK